MKEAGKIVRYINLGWSCSFLYQRDWNPTLSVPNLWRITLQLDTNEVQIDSANSTKEKNYFVNEQFTKPKKQKFYEKYIGIIIWIVAYVMFSCMSVITKWLYISYPGLHPSNANLTRAIGIPIWSLIINAVWGINPFILPKKWLPALAVKSVIQGTMHLVYYYVVYHLSIFIASQLYSTMPIFLLIISHWIGKSRMTAWDVFISLGWFFGVFCIQYDHFYSSSENSSLMDVLNNNIDIILMFVCLLLAIGQAINVLEARELDKCLHVSVPTTYSAFISIVTMCIVVAIYPHQIDVSRWDLTFILCSAIISLFWSLFATLLNLAWKFENPSVLAPFDYIYALIVFCAELFLFDTKFYLLEMIGCGIIIFCTVTKMVIHKESDPIEMEELQEEKD